VANGKSFPLDLVRQFAEKMYQEGCQEDEEAEDGKYEGLGLVEELCVASKDEKGFGQEE
jgi:hypothetical protein